LEVNKVDEELAEIRKRKLEQFMRERSYPENPVVLTEASFDGSLQKYSIVVVDCYADWCAPCRIVAPVIEDLANELAGKVVFGKLDVDKNMGIAQRFGIQSIPTLLVFKDGKLLDKIVGAVPKGRLRAYLERIGYGMEI
jgi:thioredoxin 1